MRDKHLKTRNKRPWCIAIAEIGKLPTPGRVSGFVRNDEDGDGDLEDADPPLEDVLVELFYNEGGQPGAIALESIGTDASGFFAFDDIEAGSYFLVQTNLPGYTSTGDSDADNFNQILVTLVSGGSSEDNVFLDQIDPDAPVPNLQKMAMHRLEASGIQNIDEGLSNIDAPLFPSIDPLVLINQPEVTEGLVADGVTPLVFSIQFNPASIPEPRDVTLKLKVISGGNTLLGLRDDMRILEDGIWKPFAEQLTVSSERTEIFVMIVALQSDEVSFTPDSTAIKATLSVQDKLTKTLLGSQYFRVRKPPVTLVHGYNTRGDWGMKAVREPMQEELAKTRYWDEHDIANNFVIVVKYGQEYENENSVKQDHNLQNTALPLRELAGILEEELEDALEPLKSNWAFTRHDIVAHSQGGLLARMLLSVDPPSPVSKGFRNEDNFFRGRFHRTITIGTPHNGSRLVRYLNRLTEAERLGQLTPGEFLTLWPQNMPYRIFQGLWNVYAATTVVERGIVRDKFDPIGTQIRDLNDPSPDAAWVPDPDAKIHLVRTTNNQGGPPSAFSACVAHSLIGLSNDGGTAVLPRGSDGVVDWDSMGSHASNEPTPANVYTTPILEEISHSGPKALFSRSPYFPDTVAQTASATVAKHVREALDQDLSANPSDIVFGPFNVPPILSNEELEAINQAADSLVILASNNLQRPPEALAQSDAISAEEDTLTVKLTPLAGHPVAGEILWFVELLPSSASVSVNITWELDSEDPYTVRIQVPENAYGDVVVHASYTTANGELVVNEPLVAQSKLPPDVSATSLHLYPEGVSVNIGREIAAVLETGLSDGSRIIRYLGEEVSMESSDPDVLDVSNRKLWKARTAGTATVTARFENLIATATITVETLNQTLSLEDWKQTYFNSLELADNEVSGNDADGDKDGAPLFVEYLTGGNPFIRETAPPIRISNTGTDPVIILRQPVYLVPEGSAKIEVSSNLSDWSVFYDFLQDPNLEFDRIQEVNLLNSTLETHIGIALENADSSFYRATFSLP